MVENTPTTTTTSNTPSQQKRVYVGNLPFKTRGPQLKDFFNDVIGDVNHAHIITRNFRSKGCGIVEFNTVESAEKAINLKELELEGRKLFVRCDREEKTYSTGKPSFKKRPFRPRGPPGGGRFRSGGGGFRKPRRNITTNEGDGTRVYVGNLSFNATEDDVKQLASECGNVVDVSVPTKFGDRSRGFAIVQMGSKGEAQALISKVDGFSYMQRTISARLDRFVPLDGNDEDEDDSEDASGDSDQDSANDDDE